MKKNRFLILLCAVLLLSLVSFGTLSYFTVTGTARNVVTAGNVRLGLHQTGADSGITIMPGDTVETSASVENTGAHPLYLRVKLSYSVSGDELSAEDAARVMELALNTEDWTLQEDGYYYYRTALDVGETTTALYTAVSFDGDGMDNSYLGQKLSLTVTAYGVQSENNTDSPLTALGWPAE